MSGSSPPTQQSPSLGSQSEGSVLGPGIAGLFIQGIETGLVFAQFSQWLVSHGRSESSVSMAIIIFVTIVGLYVLTNALPRDLIIYYCSSVHRLGYVLHLLGITTFSNSGSLYVSLLLHQ